MPTLQPFDSAAPRFDFTANLDRSRDNYLTIDYQLNGDLAQVVIPAWVEQSSRRDGLWQTTCFELFLGVMGRDRYWEFNLSPTGDWNVYRFDAYRQGMVEEAAIATLPFTVQIQPQTFHLRLTCDLTPLVSLAQPLEASMTSVIAQPDGTISYWAIAHCGAEADFHRRDSFVINLPTPG